MAPQPTQWSRSRQDEILSRVVGYWAQDEWVIKDCPIKTGNYRRDFSEGKTITFTCLSPTVNEELKYVCWQKLERKEWSTASAWKQAVHFKRLCECINQIAPQTISLLERPLTDWEICFRSYLIKIGKWKTRISKYLDKNNQMREVEVASNALIVLSQVYKILEEDYDERDEWDKEIWDGRKLGIKLDPSRSDYKLNFREISQAWLYKAVRQFIRYNLVANSWRDSQRKLSYIKDFSSFLKSRYPDIHPSQIDRPLVLEFFSELQKTGLSSKTRSIAMTAIQQFLEAAAREGWAEVPNQRLIYKDDYPKQEKSLPRYIPEDVLAQLNQHLEELPPYIKRMALVLTEGGMRIGELCNINYDCLIRDREGDYFLKYYQGKQKKEHSIPLAPETVALIHAQQQFVRERFGDTCPYLFVYPDESEPRPIKQDYFSDALNQLSYKYQIKNQAGKVWRFQSHQFRHTVGTRMINHGVPLVNVMRYLGHETPEMTLTYAHLHDSTLKQEYLKYKDKMVDVTGKAIEFTQIQAEMAEGTDQSLVDDQWLKRNIRAQALPNGLCALPVTQPNCPYGANRCLTGPDGKGCPHFKTDIRYLSKHKEHHERTNIIVEWAQQNPTSRRAPEILAENRPVEQNLQRIIKGLEGQSDGSGKEC